MKYLGSVKKEEGILVTPSAFSDVKNGQVFEAVEIDGDVLLVKAPLDKQSIERTERLARKVIDDHRKSMEGLAR
jgi:hypothetical protein